MSENLLFIKDVKFEKGKKVFIRCDFNVPMDEYQNITDDRRIRSALSTIKYCLDEGMAVILASHLGRPKNGFEEKFSLSPVAKRLSRLLKKDVKFVNDIIGENAQNAVNELGENEILLLDNLRFEKVKLKMMMSLPKNWLDLPIFI